MNCKFSNTKKDREAMGKSKGKKKKSNNGIGSSSNDPTKTNPSNNNGTHHEIYQNVGGKGHGKNRKKNKSKGGSSSSSDFSKDDSSFRQKLTSAGEREIIEMMADGNCLFRSISHQLYNDYGQKHHEVRQEICDYLEENEDDFKVYLLLEDSSESDDVCEFDKYVEQMREDGEWGGDVEIVCAARLYKRTVTIFSNVGAYNVSIDPDEERANPNILLSFHDNVHYNCVRDLNSPYNSTRTASAEVAAPTESKSSTSASTSSNQKAKRKKGKQKGNNTQKMNGTIQPSDQSENQSISQMTQSDLNVEQKVDQPHSNESKIADNATIPSSNDYGNKGHKSTKKGNGPKRNDQCPCGSGLRYKKCCLAKEKNKIRLEKFRERHGLQTESNDNDDSSKKDQLELEGGFAVLHI